MIKKILVVDDEKPILKMAKKALEKEGYIVITSSDSQEALNCFSAEDVDLILTDFDMSGINGLEMVKIMLIKKPDVKVVFMSGRPYNVDACRKDGFEEFLGKPFSITDLKGVIKRLLAI